MTSPGLLDNFPLIRTRDLDAVRGVLTRIYAEPKLELVQPPGKLDAAMNECELNAVRLGYSTYGAALSLEFPAADYFVQLLPVRGKGEIDICNTQVSLIAGCSASISPGTSYRATYGDGYEYFVLKIDQQALTRKLVAMTGVAIGEPLRTEPRVDVARPTAKTLQEYIARLVGTLSGAHAPLPGWWLAQTEQLLMTMFLCGHRHNYSHLLEQDAADAAPWQVRKAEEYIEANWQQPITLEDFAEVTGVSALSLFRTYKRARGYSPLEYAMRVRSRPGGMR